MIRLSKKELFYFFSHMLIVSMTERRGLVRVLEYSCPRAQL